MKKIIFFFIALIITITSCRKDIHLDDTIFIPIGEDVTTNLHGRVVDISGRSIVEAEVFVEGQTTFTNIDGYFYMPNVFVPGDGFTINVRSQNGEKVLRRVIPQAGNNTYEEIILPRGQSFVMHSGATFSTATDTTNQVTVSIQGNSLVDENNNTYSGEYLTKVIYYDPTRLTTLRSMPGNLQGVSKEGENVTLGSFGMVNIEVVGINGEDLSLAEGKLAVVRMKASALIESISSVPTWRLDENSGLWLEDGTAELQQVEDTFFYVFDISNFNSWNCDIKELNTNLSGVILDDSGVPIENRLIQMTFASEGNDFYTTGGNTNNLGKFDALVPIGKMMTLSIYDYNCTGIIYQEEIGPFNGDQSSIDIKATLTKEHYTITGVAIDCSSDLIFDNATVFLYDLNGNVRVSTQTDTDGSFAIHNTCFDINFDEGYRVAILDLDTGNYILKDSLFFAEVDIDLGNVIPCEDITEYINVVSGFGDISYENINTFFESDSLIITAGPNNFQFFLSANVSEEGINPVSNLQVRYSDDQLLTCTSQYQHTKCSEAITLTITDLDKDAQIIAGNIEGLLYFGEIATPNLTQGSDVFINFRVKY